MPKPKQRQLAWGDGDIRVHRLTDGTERFTARFYARDAAGELVRRSKTFATRPEAEQHLRTVALERLSGRYVAPSTRTVRDLVEEWLKRGLASGDWSGATYVAYRKQADGWVLPALGEVRAASLDTPRVQHWVDSLVAAGLAPTTVQLTVRVLSSALTQAVRIGALPANPCNGAVRPRIEHAEPPVWSREEIGRVIAAVRDDPLWHAIMRLMIATGMRPGELRALKWADVDWERGIVTVRRSMTKAPDGHEIVGTVTKGKRSRQIAVTPDALSVLKTWQTAQKAQRLAAETWHDEGLVFTRKDGRFLPAKTWQQTQDRIIQETGVTRITRHGLRHTSATQGMENGEHPLLVSRRLGHRSVAITLDTYSHVSADLARSAAEALDSRLFGKKGEGTGTD